MTFNWHTARGEALYYADETKQIFGMLTWADDSRRHIMASYVGPKLSTDRTRKGEVINPASDVSLGHFFDEKAAKDAVVEYVAALFPPKEEEKAA